MTSIESKEFNIGDKVLVLDKVYAIVADVYSNDDGVIKIVVESEDKGKKFWTITPKHWVKKC